MECTHETDLETNREFLTRFYKRVIRSGTPLKGTIDITSKCNLKCLHCYLSPRNTTREKELSTEQWCSIITDFVDAGCLYLLITGGEPFLRKDFRDIYLHARNKGLIISVFTNGTLVSDEIIELFKKHPPHFVEVTLYGSDREIYEKITATNGSFDKCINGLQMLSKIRTNLCVKTILMTMNQHQFDKIRKIADYYNARFRFDGAIFPDINLNQTPLKYRVSPERVVQADFSDPSKLKEWIKLLNNDINTGNINRLYSCAAGTSMFHIDSHGNLKPCLMFNSYLNFNIEQDGFLKNWNILKIEISEIKHEKESNSCSTCDKIMLCGYCPAFFNLETGSPDKKSEYLCKIGNLRYEYLKEAGNEQKRNY